MERNKDILFILKMAGTIGEMKATAAILRLF
jgi:hypothetical protein